MFGFRRSGDRRVAADDAPGTAPTGSRSHAGLGWVMAAVAAVVLVFLMAPFGSRGASPAIDPATSTGPEAPLESTGPQTWVLSSTVVTSLPTDDAADTELDDTDEAAERPAPWIIRVPRSVPTGTPDQPTSAPTASTIAPSGSSTASATTSVATTPTNAPGGSCPPASPTATASPPAVDGGATADGGPGVGEEAGPGELGSTSSPTGDAGQGAPASGSCAG